MKVYHMSEKLKLGDELKCDFGNNSSLSLPFVQALEKSKDCFYAMVLNGKYLRAVLGKFHLWEWSDYIKWSVEGAFEFIRKTEFPHCCSRINCNYYYDSLENCKILYDYDWGQASEEERAAIHLFEIELDDENPQVFDMRLYDEGYEAMEEREDVEAVLSAARKYFSGMRSKTPVLEILSDKPARTVKDISEFLKK